MPVLIAALGPRLLRVAAEAAGKPTPRVVTGLPVAVHDDVDEARTVAAAPFLVGDDPSGSRNRTRALLRELANS